MVRPFLAAAVAFVFSLEPGTWWEYRESYTEHLGEVDSTSDDVTRFEVRGSHDRLFINQKGGADPSPGPVEMGEGWIRLGPWTGEDALPLPLALVDGRLVVAKVFTSRVGFETA